MQLPSMQLSITLLKEHMTGWVGLWSGTDDLFRRKLLVWSCAVECSGQTGPPKFNIAQSSEICSFNMYWKLHVAYLGRKTHLCPYKISLYLQASIHFHIWSKFESNLWEEGPVCCHRSLLVKCFSLKHRAQIFVFAHQLNRIWHQKRQK